MSLAIAVRIPILYLIACAGLVAPQTSSGDDDTHITRITHFEDSSSDRLPTLTTVPQYPRAARRDRIEGEATVCYKINAKGRITGASVRRSSHRMFAKPSLKAIRQSSYEPLRPDQKVSKVKTCRTFRFLLNPVAIEEIG